MARVRRRARPYGAWRSAGLTDRWTGSGPLREAKGPWSHLLPVAWPPTQDSCRGDAPLKTATEPAVPAVPWLLRASPWAPVWHPGPAHTLLWPRWRRRPPSCHTSLLGPHTDPGRQTGGGGQGRQAHGFALAPPGLLRPGRRGSFYYSQGPLCPLPCPPCPFGNVPGSCNFIIRTTSCRPWTEADRPCGSLPAVHPDPRREGGRPCP